MLNVLLIVVPWISDFYCPLASLGFKLCCSGIGNMLIVQGFVIVIPLLTVSMRTGDEAPP
jgi:hypothetical protein